MGGARGATRRASGPWLTSLQAKAAGAAAVALLAFFGIVSFPDLYLELIVLGSVLIAILIGLPQHEGSEAFIQALVPSWVGFSLGTVAAYVAHTLLDASVPFDVGQDLPTFALAVGSGLFIGIAYGFLTAFLSAAVAVVRTAFLDRRGRRQRRPGPAEGSPDPDDPFGWGDRSQGPGGLGRR